MKRPTGLVSQIQGRSSFQDVPYYLESKTSKAQPKIAKTERPTSKNGKQDLLEYFKKERNTLTQVSNNIRNQLQQSKSIDTFPSGSQKSERLKTIQYNHPDQRVQTDDGNSARKPLLKGKNLSLATVQLEKREFFKYPGTTKQQFNQTPQSFIKSVNPKSNSKDQLQFDMQLVNLGKNKQLKNAQTIQQEYQQYFTLKQNKQSIQSDGSNQRHSIEDILNNQRLLKGSMLKGSLKKYDIDQKSYSQSQSQQKSESVKKKLDESNHFDPKKQLQIILYYKSQKYHILLIRYHFLYDYQNQNTDQLYNYLIQQIACIERSFSKLGEGTGSTESDSIQQEINKICQFQTVSKNVPHDYYLSIPNLSLNQFHGVTLQLQPLYQLPACGKRVTLKDFTLVKCIGVGGFSRVYLVRKKDNGKFYALKLIDKKFIMDNQKEIIVQNERDIMVKMDNQFITPLHFAFETKFYIAFVLDYCAGGELFYHLRKLRRLSEMDAKFYFVEICIGMAYLHSQNIVYRDIKPENILLDLQGHLLLSDFGLSKPDMSSEDFAYSFCGSPEYMAPEMLMKTGHNYLVDCYCLGALLYELVTGLPPFYSHNTQEIYNSILTDTIQFPPYVQITNTLKDLIQQLLQKDPTERLGQNGGIVEILTHPWFAEVDFESIVNRKNLPPYRPDPLKYNFDEEEFNKGDAEFRKQYAANLQKEFANGDNHSNFVLKNFYYSRENVGGPEKTTRTNIVNMNAISMQATSTETQSPTSKNTRIIQQSPQEGKRVNKVSGKSDIANDYFKRHDILTKSSQILHQQQQSKLGHSYSKTMQAVQTSANDLKNFKLLIDQSKALLSTERTSTLPDQSHHKLVDRVKTEQIGVLASPKTTTNSQSQNKQSNFQKLFGTEKRKGK